MPTIHLIGRTAVVFGTHAVLGGGVSVQRVFGSSRIHVSMRGVLKARRALRGSLVAGAVASGTMPKTRPNYLALLQNLLPPGAAWTRARDAQMTALLAAFAREFERVHDRAQALLDEADPSRTVELLPDWERVAALPDAYLSPDTTEGRQQALVAKLSFRGDQSRAAYIAAAQELGYTVTIREFRPFDCLSTCVDSISQGLWVFAWQVITTTGPDDALLEGVFRSRAQLHSSLLFQYV